jgi:hypothetical protein
MCSRSFHSPFLFLFTYACLARKIIPHETWSTLLGLKWWVNNLERATSKVRALKNFQASVWSTRLAQHARWLAHHMYWPCWPSTYVLTESVCDSTVDESNRCGCSRDMGSPWKDPRFFVLLCCAPYIRYSMAWERSLCWPCSRLSRPGLLILFALPWKPGPSYSHGLGHPHARIWITKYLLRNIRELVCRDVFLI